MASTRMPAQALRRLAAFQRATQIGMSTSPITRAGGRRELYAQLLRRLTEPGYRQAVGHHPTNTKATRSARR
jgi:hypothetical protein